MNQEIEDRRTWYDGAKYMSARQFVAMTWARYSGPGKAAARAAAWRKGRELRRLRARTWAEFLADLGETQGRRRMEP